MHLYTVPLKGKIRKKGYLQECFCQTVEFTFSVHVFVQFNRSRRSLVCFALRVSSHWTLYSAVEQLGFQCCRTFQIVLKITKRMPSKAPLRFLRNGVMRAFRAAERSLSWSKAIKGPSKGSIQMMESKFTEKITWKIRKNYGCTRECWSWDRDSLLLH